MDTYNPYHLFCGSFVPNWLQKRSIKEVSQGAKLCFARLCQYAGPDGNCYPKIDSLAEELGVERRTARRYIKELKSLKLLKTAPQGKHMPNSYVFLKHEWMSSLKSMEDNSVPSGRTILSPPYKKNYINNIITMSSSEKEEENIKNKKIKESAKEVLGYLNQKATSSFRNVDTNLNGIITLLKDKVSVNECKEVIDIKTKEWRNTDMEKYLRPSTLFRRSNFENYYGLCKHIYNKVSKKKNSANQIVYYKKQIEEQYPIDDTISDQKRKYNKLQRDGINHLVKNHEAVLIQ